MLLTNIPLTRCEEDKGVFTIFQDLPTLVGLRISKGLQFVEQPYKILGHPGIKGHWPAVEGVGKGN